MKIVCESCQSKYTVADEKVQGKTAKIKCKKCGATILVNSGGVVSTTGAASGNDAGAQAASSTSYMVNVADGDQRTMSVDELVAAYNQGTINGETFIWADGMPDWQPLSAVDEVVSALHAQSPGDSGAAAAPQEASVSQPARAAVRRDASRSADLFGSRPEAAEIPAAMPSFGSGDAGRMTGQREESSMLFSLSALTAKAPVSQTTATKEDSGLIDLRALGAGSVPAVSSDLLPDSVALLPLGAPPAPPSQMPVVAPIASMPPPAKSKTPIFIAVGAVVAIAAVAIAFVVTKEPPPPPPTVATQAAPTETVPSAEPSAPPAVDPGAQASVATSASAAPSSAPVAAGGNRPSGGSKPASGGSKPAGGDTGSKPASTATTPPKPSKGNCGCAAGDLMCAMRCSAGGK